MSITQLGESIYNDLEAISYRKLQQPETLTVESVQRVETIEQNRKQTVNNASDLISTINLAQNALKKNFDSVSMKSPEYNQKLNEYVKQSDELKKMSDYVVELFNEAMSPKENTIEKVNKVRQDLGLPVPNYRGTTGSAADINNKLAFEEIQIPYKNDNQQEETEETGNSEETPTVLHGYVEKSDDYLREINHELHKLEEQDKNKLNLIINKKKLKQYSEISRFNRLKQLVEALFYVIRSENISPNEKISEFKKEMEHELYEYDQTTYPKRRINISKDIKRIIISIKDLNDAYIIWKYNKTDGDYIRLIKFLRCLSLWRETNKSLDKFYARPDINITNEEVNIKNDMRHITGLVFYTQKYGAEQARKYGYLKEKLDYYQEGDIKDTFIDFDNNERGIAFGLKYKNLSKEKTIEKIYEEFIKPKRIKLNY